MLRASKQLLLGLVAVLAFAGTHTAQAASKKNVCVNACMARYAGNATSAATPACTDACKGMSKPRHTCLREGEWLDRARAIMDGLLTRCPIHAHIHHALYPIYPNSEQVLEGAAQDLSEEPPRDQA